MSIRDCIIGKIGRPGVDPARAKEATDLMDEIKDQFGGRMGSTDADVMAGIRAQELLAAETARRRKNTMRMIIKTKQIKGEIDSYLNARGRKDPGQAATNKLSPDNHQRSNVENVETRAKSIEYEAQGLLADFMESTRSKMLGLKRETALADNIVRELAGGNTGDEVASAASKAWERATEFLRKRFNQAGGNIPKRVDWMLPQTHDMLAVAEAGGDEWKPFVRNLLDRDQMIDDATGLPMSEAKFEQVLDEAFRQISTDGHALSKPSGLRKGRKSVANSRTDRRVLIFKDADSWLEYQKKFGNPDLLETMHSHIHRMSLDIARMEVLGPNPDAMLEFMKQYVTREATLAGRKAIGVAEGRLNHLDQINNEQTGVALIPVHTKWAEGFAAARNVLTSAQLGGAAITAVTDLAFQKMARGFNGLPGVSKSLPEIFRLMSSVEDQKFAVRMGLSAEMWSGVGLGVKRFAHDVVGPQWSRTFADVTIRASGLSTWTQAGRHSFGMDFLSHLHDNYGKSFGAMDPATARALERYGIGESQWNKITRDAFTEHRGVKFADIQKIREIDPDLGQKVHQMILSETEFAVPTVGDRQRALLRGGTRPGTFAGELMSSVAMYKSFPTTIVMTHLMRGLSEAGGDWKNPYGGAYLANLVISTTIMGALAIQAKNIAKGKDPQPMNAKFWGAAMVQGGGLGIMGDFFFSDTSRYGRGYISQIAGPVAGLGEDIGRLTKDNIVQLAQGKETNFAGEAVRFAGRYTPIAASLWYSRQAFERGIINQLELLVDPNAGDRFRRQERRTRNDYDTEFFWSPGEAPSRAPRLENAIPEILRGP